MTSVDFDAYGADAFEEVDDVLLVVGDAVEFAKLVLDAVGTMLHLRRNAEMVLYRKHG